MARQKTIARCLPLGLAAGLLAACSNPRTIPDPESEPGFESGGAAMGADSADSVGSGDFAGFGGGEEIPFVGEAGEALADTIYFDFDSYEIRSSDARIVNRHSLRLLDSGARVRLEGHADERGSREYNIGLGERRAQAVRRMLMIQGVPATQIATVSFGEERPIEFGSDEAAYAANRRVVIRYTK